MSSPAAAAFLFAAGVLAGIVGTGGGITSLVSYPALLIAGVPALSANVTNVVALVACWPGSAVASRPELAGQARWLRRFGVVAGAGGLGGAGLLLSTPAGVFSRVVPFLLVGASLTLLAQPRISRWTEHRPSAGNWFLSTALFAVSVYNGYFGAGAGVMVLALLLVTVDQHVARANALKNMLVGAATVASAVAYALAGHVRWADAGPLAAGLFLGATIGPTVARRIPGGLLRWLVALTGIGLAVRFWVAPL